MTNDSDQFAALMRVYSLLWMLGFKGSTREEERINRSKKNKPSSIFFKQLCLKNKNTIVML